MLNMLRNLNWKTFPKKNLDLFDQRAKIGKKDSTHGSTRETITIGLSQSIVFIFEINHKILIWDLKLHTKQVSFECLSYKLRFLKLKT
jgi:hypothetical protein